MCVVCEEYSEGIAHTYTDGFCACGAEAPNIAEGTNWYITGGGTLHITGLVENTSDEADDFTPWFEYKSQIKKVIAEDGAKITNGARLFSQCTNLVSADLSKLDTTGVTLMNDMFSGCSNLTVLNFSGFDTSSVTNASDMFAKCSKLEKIDVQSFDLSSIEMKHAIFNFCYGLKEIALNKSVYDHIIGLSFLSDAWYDKSTGIDIAYTGISGNTTIVKNIADCDIIAKGQGWYIDSNGCLHITGDIENYSETQDETPWKEYKSQIKSVVISEGAYLFNGAYLFADCENIEELDLSSIDKIDNADNMLSGCTGLKKITLNSDLLKMVAEQLTENGAEWYYTPCGDKSASTDTLKKLEGKVILAKDYDTIADDVTGHVWQKATCTEPKTCTVCGKTEGSSLGHNWTDATCTAPRTCSRCQTTVGSPLGHKYELIKKLSDSPLTYTAECLRCGEYNEAYEVPEKIYDIFSKVTTKSVKVGNTVKPNNVITLDFWDSLLSKTIDVYIDGVRVYSSKNDYITPNYCLKCVSKSDTTLYFETDCMFIRANCTDPKTCVYCGHTVGEKGHHNFENGVCTVCGVGLFEFDSKSLALDSALAFKFKGYLYDENPAEDAYMEFKIGNIRNVEVPLKDAIKDEKGRYVFTCYLNVLEVDEKIEAIFHDGEETVERQNPLSVTDYLDLVLEKHQGGTEEDKIVIDIVNSISNYAHCGQVALDETHDEYTVGEGGTYHGTAARSEVTLKTTDELSEFNAVKTVKEGYTAIKSSSRSLVLDDKTAIVVYLTPTDLEYVPTIKVTDKSGENVEFTCEKQENGKWKIVIHGIAAHM